MYMSIQIYNTGSATIDKDISQCIAGLLSEEIKEAIEIALLGMKKGGNLTVYY